MGIVSTYHFGIPTINTFIGGISSNHGTAALLATRLGISVNRISNFSVVGPDIQCRISGSYVIPGFAFSANAAITFYNDKGGLVTGLGNSAFNACTALNYVYIPSCTTMVTPAGWEFIFQNIKTGCILTVDISMMTNNGGLPDADIVHLTDSRAGFVNYAGTPPVPNTEIGGVAATLNTIPLVAAKLNISKSRVTNLIIEGNNIRFKTVGNRFSPGNLFKNDTNLTYFRDNDRLLQKLENGDYEGCTNLAILQIYGVKDFGTGGFVKISGTKIVDLYFPELWYLSGNLSINNNTLLKTFDAPICIYGHGGGSILANNNALEYVNMPSVINQFGTTIAGNEGTFSNCKIGCVFNLHPLVLINNAGMPDGDIMYVIEQRNAVINGQRGDNVLILSLRLVRPEYTGNCIKVRRTTDGTTMDIGFVGGVLDTATLLTFVGTDGGYVERWYDQCWGRDMVQTNAAAQPVIAENGIVLTLNNKPAIFCKTGQYMTTVNSVNILGTPADIMSGYLVGARGSTGGGANMIGADGSSGYNHYTINPGNGAVTFRHNSTQSLSVTDVHGYNTQQLYEMVRYSSANIRYYRNNVLKADQPMNGVWGRWMTIGNATFGPADAYYQEVRYFRSDISSELATINAEVNAFYNIY